MSKGTSPRKVAMALWIYSLTLATIVVFVNIWRQIFNPDLIEVMRFVRSNVTRLASIVVQLLILCSFL